MHVMTHRQDDPQGDAAPARSADILPFRRPATPPPVPSLEPAPPYDDIGDDGDDDGPSAA
jgi:hypothetical protein